jgi:hypothetical protein
MQYAMRRLFARLFPNMEIRGSDAMVVSILSFLGYVGHLCAACFSPFEISNAENKKTAIGGGFSGNSG